MALRLLKALLLHEEAVRKQNIYKDKESTKITEHDYNCQIKKKICRICGEDGDIAIFNYKAGKTIAEDINRCSGITVSPNDGFPSFICGSCFNLLQNALKFRKMCLESVSKMRGLRLKSEVIITLEPKKEVLSDCGDSDGDDALPSRPAGANTSSLAADTRHVYDSDEYFADITPVHLCISCHRNFLSIAEYRKHLPSCSDALLRSKMSGFRSHTNKPKKVRKKKGPFLCEVCGKSLKHLSSYLAHKSVHSNVFPYKCEQCAYRGKTKDLLRTHQKSHLRVKPYVCEVCSVTCSTSSNLAKHRLIHETPEPLQCPQCEKMYNRKEQLARHIADIHVGSQPVDCNICGKRFLRRKSLVKHRLKQHKLRNPRGGRLPAYLLAQDAAPPAPAAAPGAHREATADAAGPNSAIWFSRAGSRSESTTYGTDIRVDSSGALQ